MKPGDNLSDYLYSSGSELFGQGGGSAAVVKSAKTLERDTCTFSDIVDKACEGMMEKQFKYSIRKLHEMEETLSVIEHELDEFLGTR